MRSIERSPSSKQGGFAAVMFLILLGLFLTFAAFALDLGNYYLWKLRMDKIARAAVSAGLGRRALDGYATTLTGGSNSVTTAMRQVVEESFNSYGVPEEASDGEGVNYRILNTAWAATDEATVGVEYRAPMILLDKITSALGYGFNASPENVGKERRFASGYPWVSAHHSATLSSTNVVLLLDVSGSMLCPSVGDCACRRTNTCTGINKLTLMAQGVTNFVSMFNPNRDRIAVIPFNLAAQRLYSFTVGGQAAGNVQSVNSSASLNTNITADNAGSLLRDPEQLATVLTGLAGSNTNHCDALAEGIQELENLSTALYGATGFGSDRKRLKPFVVLFTDGAPNAMRGIFGVNGTSVTAECWDYNGNRSYIRQGACGSQDMYHYALEWVHNESGGSPRQYRGPGPFILRQTTVPNGFVPTIFRHPISGTAVAPVGSRVCGQHSPDPRRFEQTITRSTGGGPGRRGDATTGCLSGNIFEFAIPYTNVSPNENGTNVAFQAIVQSAPISTGDTTWQDPNWPPSFFTAAAVAPPAPATYGLQKYDELPYYCAIEAADFIRTRYGATIFTIGLGPTATHDNAGGYNSANCNDPMQDPDDHVGRKDFFLARLAFSNQMFQDPALPVTVNPHYQFKGAIAQGLTRNVTTCQTPASATHRFRASTPLPPDFVVGYTSGTGLQDGSTTYRDLRPPRPAWEDGQTPVRRIDTQGEYFPSNDPLQVPVIFGNIAKKILLRAIS